MYLFDPYKYVQSNLSILNQGTPIKTISVRQAGEAAHCAVTLEGGRPLDRHASGDRNVKFRIFLTQTFPLYGATSYILPSRTMSQLFNGGNFVYRSVEVCCTSSHLFASFSQNTKLLQWRTVLTTLVICWVMF